MSTSDRVVIGIRSDGVSNGCNSVRYCSSSPLSYFFFPLEGEIRGKETLYRRGRGGGGKMCQDNGGKIGNF